VSQLTVKAKEMANMNAKVEQAKLSRIAVLQEKLSEGGGVLSDALPPKLLAQTLPNADLRIPVDKLQAPLQYTVPKPVNEYPNDLLWPEARKKGAADWENVLPDPHYIDLGEVADGETITVKWVPYDNAEPPAPISGADTTTTYPIVGAYPEPGVLIEIGDYPTHFKPAHLGKGRVTYSISRGAGAPTPDSLPAEHVVFLKDNQGKYCDET
jgi:hypothetical protein